MFGSHHTLNWGYLIKMKLAKSGEYTTAFSNACVTLACSQSLQGYQLRRGVGSESLRSSAWLIDGSRLAAVLDLSSMSSAS
jgi:hypothetical protein